MSFVQEAPTSMWAAALLLVVGLAAAGPEASLTTIDDDCPLAVGSGVF